eukprot:1138531-Pelagomonas_calceolata.AAC.8
MRTLLHTSDPNPLHPLPCLQYVAGYKITKFSPFNPVDKKTTAHTITPTGEKLITTKGAPQIIGDMLADPAARQACADYIAERASRGLRSLGVARSDDDGQHLEAKLRCRGAVQGCLDIQSTNLRPRQTRAMAHHLLCCCGPGPWWTSCPRYFATSCASTCTFDFAAADLVPGGPHVLTWSLVGLISLLDPPRPDSGETIKLAQTPAFLHPCALSPVSSLLASFKCYDNP